MKIRFIKDMRIQRYAAVIAAFIILPAAALAQTPEIRINTALSQATQVGIPVSLLESKVAEGKAKGIPMDRIAAAVESRLKGLEQARTAMNRGAHDIDAAQLAVGADAIGAGVSEAVLEKITATTPKDRRAVALTALTQLVSEGIVPEAALLRVQDALARGPEALANLAARSGVGVGGPRGTGPSTPGSSAAGGPPAPVPAPGQGSTAPVPPRGGRSGL